MILLILKRRQGAAVDRAFELQRPSPDLLGAVGPPAAAEISADAGVFARDDVVLNSEAPPKSRDFL